MTIHHLFAYGTLQVDVIIAHIVGRSLTAQAARLTGYARFRVRERAYPAVVEAPGSEVLGVVYLGLTGAELERLDAYEGELYERREVRVWLGEGTLGAITYALRPEHAARLSDEQWELERFERDHLASYLAEIRLTSRAP